MLEITNKIYYVGVNDRNKSLFEGLWPLPNGVSYNSYLIDDEKVCLISVGDSNASLGKFDFNDVNCKWNFRQY